MQRGISLTGLMKSTERKRKKISLSIYSHGNDLAIMTQFARLFFKIPPVATWKKSNQPNKSVLLLQDLLKSEIIFILLLFNSVATRCLPVFGRNAISQKPPNKGYL